MLAFTRAQTQIQVQIQGQTQIHIQTRFGLKFVLILAILEPEY